MIEPRLVTAVAVSALGRIAAQRDAFVTVIRKGDEIAGALLLHVVERGRDLALLERVYDLDGHPHWQEISLQANDKSAHIGDYLARRRTRDPDLWIVELDIPFPERLADIIGTVD